jgi:hypothetical protein
MIRFASFPAYGKSVIRRFSNKVTDMHQFAGHNWEDILQCICAAAEGLLPAEHDAILLDLLFSLVFLHALSMLRMHTDFTLDVMRLEVARLGYELRRFNHCVCPDYDTRETPKEQQARSRRQTAAQRAQSGAASAFKRQRMKDVTEGPVKKPLSLSTYKLHIIGHYPEKIAAKGTTDNYNTKVVCISFLLPVITF